MTTMRVVKGKFGGKPAVYLLDGEERVSTGCLPEDEDLFGEIAGAVNFCRAYLPTAQKKLAAILHELDNLHKGELRLHLEDLQKLLTEAAP